MDRAVFRRQDRYLPLFFRPISYLNVLIRPELILAGTIGISNYASKALGDVVYVELPTIPLTVKQGDTIGAVESVKSASDITSPASGTITEANNTLEDKPGFINVEPQGEAWFAKIELEEEGGGDEYKSLMDEEGYGKFVGTEE